MTEQNLDSNLKERDYTKWVETQSTEALEKELSALELRRTVLQNTAPEMEASMEQQTGEDWTEEWAENYNAEMAAATTLEEKKKIQERYEGPRYDEITESRLAQEAAELLEKPASLEAGIEPEESEIPPWLAERMEATQRLEAVRRELIARRLQELSRGKTASSQESKIDPDVVKRRTIVKQNRELETIRICGLLDYNAVPLPLRDDDMEDFSTSEHPWTDAFNKRPISEKRRSRIRVIISKDKKA